MSSLGTHFSYDDIPYPDLSYIETHPDRLAMIGTLLGMLPAKIEACRVLEIGCAGGSNLIPMAEGLPNSTFVGIDYSAVQIAQAEAVRAALGLPNITFQHVDIMDVTAEFGQFDYIIAHGIYSWVPVQVRDRLLAICKQNLAPQGIAYISYNTYPGWHMVDTMRNMMLYRTRNIENPNEKSRLAREWITFMADALADKPDSAYGAIFRNYLQSRMTQTDEFDHSVLLHDELEAVNQPFYFHEFATAAEQHGLQYLAEAEFPMVMPNGLRPEVAEFLADTAETTIEMEQYMDFVRNRGFRRTLLIHDNLELSRQLGIAPVRNFYVVSEAHPAGDSEATAPNVERFSAPDGTSFATDHPVTKMAFRYLMEISPRAVSFMDLFKEACKRLNIQQPVQQDAVALAANLLQAFTYSLRLIEFRVRAPAIVTEATERPVSSRLARFQASRGSRVTSPSHRRVEMDTFTRTVLLLLDGEHDRAALLDYIVNLAQEGKIGVKDGGDAATGPERIRELLQQELDEALLWLAHAGLLVG